MQAVTDARITSVRLISFINEGDSVRVKMAFRVRTVLDETGEEGTKETPKPTKKTRADKKKLARLTPPADEEDSTTSRAPEPEKVVPAREPVKRNPKAIGSAEVKEVLFEITGVKSSGNELSVFIEVTNMTEDSYRYVAIYDEAYRWAKSRVMDTAEKEYEVSQVVFWKGQQKTSMYDAGNRGVPIDPRTMQTAQLIFKKVPANLKTINKLTIHPFVYQRKVVIWTWQEQDLVFQNIRVSR